MSKKAELLGRPVNSAAVQLPERKYPGVVVQGDMLNSLVRRLEEMGNLAKTKQLEDLETEIEEMREQLSSARDYYEVICAEHRVELPYSKLAL